MHAFTVEEETMADGQPWWSAVCECGWRSRWVNPDEYGDDEDPNHSAFLTAEDYGREHHRLVMITRTMTTKNTNRGGTQT